MIDVSDITKRMASSQEVVDSVPIDDVVSVIVDTLELAKVIELMSGMPDNFVGYLEFIRFTGCRAGQILDEFYRIKRLQGYGERIGDKCRS